MARTNHFASELTDMSHATAGPIGRQIESLFEGGSVAGLTDRQLLERFTAGRDAAGDAAFVAIVTRYGPMVLRVCRQLLGDRHHAEDAFQAVFLVLARKGPSIRNPDLLGTWLYGVAIRTARKARVRLDRRRRNEESDAARRQGWGSSGPVDPTVPPAEVAALAREQAEALHAEIDRLPDSFRRRWCSATSRASPSSKRRDVAAARRHDPEPIGAGTGEAPPRPLAPRLRPRPPR